MNLAIDASGIEKTFTKKRSIGELLTHPFRPAERVRALKGIDLEVRQGEIFGLLGPNGAGKTTLLKVLSCLILPDKGRARILGLDTVHETQVKRLIGLVHTDERSFYWRLSARENLRFFARLYDLPGSAIDSRIDELLERVDMTEPADRPFSGYSSGMKQRVAIARALLHDPPILLMDEPTRSLDPGTAATLRDYMLEKLNHRDGKTILLATHNLREAETMADRVAIIAHGTVQQVGTVEEVRRWGLRGERFTLEIEPYDGPLQGPFRVLSDEDLDGQRKVTVWIEEGQRFEDMLRSLLASGVQVRSCDRAEADLEAAFARILKTEGSEA